MNRQIARFVDEIIDVLYENTILKAFIDESDFHAVIDTKYLDIQNAYSSLLMIGDDGQRMIVSFQESKKTPPHSLETLTKLEWLSRQMHKKNV